MGDQAEEAEKLKQQANEHFAKGLFEKAIDGYSEAISLDPCNAILFSNRSFAHLKMESYGYSLADANKAIELNPNFIKAYYRRASANFALGKFKVALKDFESVAKAKPTDSDAQKRFKGEFNVAFPIFFTLRISLCCFANKISCVFFWKIVKVRC